MNSLVILLLLVVHVIALPIEQQDGNWRTKSRILAPFLIGGMFLYMSPMFYIAPLLYHHCVIDYNYSNYVSVIKSISNSGNGYGLDGFFFSLELLMCKKITQCASCEIIDSHHQILMIGDFGFGKLL